MLDERFIYVTAKLVVAEVFAASNVRFCSHTCRLKCCNLAYPVWRVETAGQNYAVCDLKVMVVRQITPTYLVSSQQKN